MAMHGRKSTSRIKYDSWSFCFATRADAVQWNSVDI